MYKVIVVILLVTVALGTADDKYTSKYDNINIDEILANPRILDGYCKCLLDQGPCTPEGAELKKDIPDALQNECSKCNEKQKNAVKKVVHFLIDNNQECWKPLEAKYDPTGEYSKRYKDHLKN